MREVQRCGSMRLKLVRKQLGEVRSRRSATLSTHASLVVVEGQLAKAGVEVRGGSGRWERLKASRYYYAVPRASPRSRRGFESFWRRAFSRLCSSLPDRIVGFKFQ